MSPHLAAADDPLKEKHQRVQREIKSAREDLDESSARAHRTYLALQRSREQLSSARDALAAARARLTAARIKDRQMQRALDAAIAKLTAARGDLATGQQEVADKREQIADMLADTYQQGDPQLLNLAALLNSTTPAELTSEAQTGDVVVENNVQALDELRAAEVLLQVREQRVEDAKADTAAKRREAAQQLAEKQRLEQEAAAAKSTLQTTVTKARDAKAAAAEARQADLKEWQRLKSEDQRIQAMLKRRAEQAAARNGGSSTPQPSGGYLSYPVNGPVTSPFGYRVHPIYGYYSLHDGTDFGAGCGAPLYSAADGTVIQSYWNTAYGNRMIIDNGFVRGVSLATIYNHAIRYTVGVGDHVTRGQVIGYVGTTGWSTGCHLHFTVMVNGTPVDPMKWL